MLGALKFFAALAACAAFLLFGEVFAQPLPRAVVQQRAARVDELFNWYYAAAYGTGVYRIGDETVGVLRAPFSYRLREVGDGQLGIRFTFPVSAALSEFDLTDFQFGHVRAAGLSIMPGIEVEVPLSERWMLKPFANAGPGWEFKRETSAMIYSAGVATVYRLPLGKGRRSSLGGKLTFAGYDAGGESSGLAALAGGGDYEFPIDMQIAGQQALLGMQLTGTVYFNRLEFLLPNSADRKVSAEMEFAVTLGVRKPTEFLGMGIDRVGLGFRRGSNGLKGLRLVGSFPF